MRRGKEMMSGQRGLLGALFADRGNGDVISGVEEESP